MRRVLHVGAGPITVLPKRDTGIEQHGMANWLAVRAFGLSIALRRAADKVSPT
jgi:hypothetical protein